jgi:hypothetical protein
MCSQNVFVEISVFCKQQSTRRPLAGVFFVTIKIETGDTSLGTAKENLVNITKTRIKLDELECTRVDTGRLFMLKNGHFWVWGSAPRRQAHTELFISNSRFNLKLAIDQPYHPKVKQLLL